MERFFIRPQEHGLDLTSAAINSPYNTASWPSKNFRIQQRSIQKRWGYNTADRALGAAVQHIVLYALKDGTRRTLYLTDADLCMKETGTSDTWSYKTTITTYTSKIASISATTVTLKAGETPATDGVADGDYFILSDDYTADREPQSAWASIASASDSVPSITLDSNYTGTTGSWGGSEKTGYVRHVYTTPTNERWWYVIIDDKFIFGNGNTNTQYWANSGYAADLAAATAIKARCGVAYANRLFIADYGTTRDPVGIAWSKAGDPTDFTSAGSGSGQLIESKDFIINMGVVGASLVIYKTDSIAFGARTGDYVSPISLPHTGEKRGVGLVARGSLVDVMGTNAFLGRNDFYVINGEQPEPIGGKIRNKFFSIVDATEIERTIGYHNDLLNEIMWIATTSEGKLAFVWNYKENEWQIYSFAEDMVGTGKGAL